MSGARPDKPLVAIACGGTGGHLFPGLAVAEKLAERRADVMLLISPKEVDQQAVKSAIGMEVVVLPAVGLTRGRVFKFVGGFLGAYRAAKTRFRSRPPQAVLAMGGFTSAPPVFAGRSLGAVSFLHDSNTIPGRANRLLAHFVDQAFVGFSEAAGLLHSANVLATGTPVRPQFEAVHPAACRVSLGLAADRPVLLVMGGSQGAAGINDLVLKALPELLQKIPTLQVLHLSGIGEQAKVESAYEQLKIKAVIKPFLTEMELALGAATVAVSRAGASTLAELAAMELPALLIPYPASADDHQFFNAKAFVDRGAARLLDQKATTPTELAAQLQKLLEDEAGTREMKTRLKALHTPQAAELIAEKIMLLMQARGKWIGSAPAGGQRSSHEPLRHKQAVAI